MKTPPFHRLLFAGLTAGSLLFAPFAKAALPSDALLSNGLPPGARALKIGDPAPDFSLLGVDGKRHRLADFKNADVLMVVFLSNHCPVSHAAESRILAYLPSMRDRSFAVVAINPNDPAAIRVEQLGYTKYTDSYEDMKRYAKDQNFPFPYLYDGETQETSKAYGALCTPHIFVFDRERRLRYEGRFDNSRLPHPASVTRREVPEAIEALLAGRPVPVAETRPVGCWTVWKLRTIDVVKADADWERAPVTVDTLDAAGVAALARNPTSRFRLINVWATWCVPCVEEFPGLISLTRRFATRPIDLITISLDDPKEQPKVAQFLESQHAAVPGGAQKAVKSQGRRTNCYVFTGANADAFGQALDPAWPGPLPYTVVIAPGGQVIYRHSGGLDLDALRAFLVEKMGPYYDRERIQADR